jgi:16S rRNA (cytosine1402-N4)-methyltransferase
MLTEILDLLEIQDSDIVLDGTLGFAGHSSEFLKKVAQPEQLHAIDQDPEAISFSRKRLGQGVNIAQCNFSDFDTAFSPAPKFNKILLDLGFSSFQLDASNRGFSHQGVEPLDMRMNPNEGTSAADILNTYSEQELSDIFYNWGDLRQNKILSKNILHHRPFTTTDQLMDCIKKSYSFNNNRSKFMKTSAQVFQALRMEVNNEFDHIVTFINKLADNTAPKARIAILTFHSGEDRLVKHTFRDLKDTFKKINKHVITATQDEIRSNSRSKPAKLRVYEKIDPTDRMKKKKM